MLATFQDLGRDMFLTGLVGSHTGTMSMRLDGRAIISRRTVMLGRLAAEDLIEFEIDGECPDEAPDDAIVHQAIYRATDAQAVIHARPPATMALALIEDRLGPPNGEGGELLGNAPVLISQRPIGSRDVAQLVSRTLRENRVVALRGQGVFARGRDLADAFRMVSLLEEMCKVAHIFRTLSREERQPALPEWQDRPPTRLSPFRNKNDLRGQRGGGRPLSRREPGPGLARRGDRAGRPPSGEGRRPGGPRRRPPPG